MTIENFEKIEIEIQEQKMLNPGTKYLVLIKSEGKNNLKILTTNSKPIIKLSEDNGTIAKKNTNY